MSLNPIKGNLPQSTLDNIGEGEVQKTSSDQQIKEVSSGVFKKIQEIPDVPKIPSQVRQDPLQQSLKETKTKERELVFKTLQEKSETVLESYKESKQFEKRLKKELFRESPKLEEEKVDELINEYKDTSPHKIGKGELAEKIFLKLGIEKDRAKRIAERACIAFSKPISYQMPVFKGLLAYGIIKEREKDFKKELDPKEIASIRKQVKKLNLGSDPKKVTKEALKKKIYKNGILREKLSDVIAEKMCCQSEIAQLTLLNSDLRSMHTFKNKLLHKIMNQRAKDGYPLTKEEVKKLKERIDNLGLGDDPKKVRTKELVKKLYEEGLVRKSTAKKIAGSVCKECKRALKGKGARKNARELALFARDLNSLLKETPSEKKLKQTITLLRKAFNTKAYQALKEQEDNPTIHYLHELNLAMYKDVHLLNAYVAKDGEEGLLGDKLVQGHEEKPFKDMIQEVRNDAVQNRGLFSSHSCLKYILNHFKQFWGAFTSQKIGSPFGTYDPHGELGNNTGALYEETLKIGREEGKAFDIRTPSPTVGDSISLEFRSALQAIQNQSVSEFLGEEGYERPNCWIYTNYQDITNEGNGEHGRSKAIMKLNEEFPLSFKGITLSKDSAYFLEGLGHGEGEKLWESIDKEKTFNKDSIEAFTQGLKESLTREEHFSLENRSKKEKKAISYVSL